MYKKICYAALGFWSYAVFSCWIFIAISIIPTIIAQVVTSQSCVLPHLKYFGIIYALGAFQSVVTITEYVSSEKVVTSTLALVLNENTQHHLEDATFWCVMEYDVLYINQGTIYGIDEGEWFKYQGGGISLWDLLSFSLQIFSEKITSVCPQSNYELYKFCLRYFDRLHRQHRPAHHSFKLCNAAGSKFF